MTPELQASLPPTDSRWRADLRALEEGRYAEVLQRPCHLPLHAYGCTLCEDLACDDGQLTHTWSVQAQHEHRKLRAHNAAQVARILGARRQPLHLAHSPAWFELLDPKDAPGVTPAGVRLRYRFKQGPDSFWAVHARAGWNPEQEHGCLAVKQAGCA